MRDVAKIASFFLWFTDFSCILLEKIKVFLKTVQYTNCNEKFFSKESSVMSWSWSKVQNFFFKFNNIIMAEQKKSLTQKAKEAVSATGQKIEETFEATKEKFSEASYTCMHACMHDI